MTLVMHGQSIAFVRDSAASSKGDVFVKDMTYHVAAVADRKFLEDFRNVFIIRHPALVLRSLRNLVPPEDIEPSAYSSLYSIYQSARGLRPEPDPIVLLADDFVPVLSD